MDEAELGEARRQSAGGTLKAYACWLRGMQLALGKGPRGQGCVRAQQLLRPRTGARPHSHTRDQPLALVPQRVELRALGPLDENEQGGAPLRLGGGAARQPPRDHVVRCRPRRIALVYRREWGRRSGVRLGALGGAERRRDRGHPLSRPRRLGYAYLGEPGARPRAPAPPRGGCTRSTRLVLPCVAAGRPRRASAAGRRSRCWSGRRTLVRHTPLS